MHSLRARRRFMVTLFAWKCEHADGKEISKKQKTAQGEQQERAGEPAEARMSVAAAVLADHSASNRPVLQVFGCLGRGC